jgi:hypothetical protein
VFTISLSGSQRLPKLVRRLGRELNVGNADIRSVHGLGLNGGSLDIGILKKAPEVNCSLLEMCHYNINLPISLEVLNDLFGLASQSLSVPILLIGDLGVVAALERARQDTRGLTLRVRRLENENVMKLRVSFIDYCS